MESSLSFSIDAHFRDHSLLFKCDLITYLFDLPLDGKLLLFLSIAAKLCVLGDLIKSFQLIGLGAASVGEILVACSFTILFGVLCLLSQ